MFRYLVRVLSDDDNDLPCILSQLASARRWWQSFALVLKRKGVDVRVMAMLYIAIVQAVLLYSADSWSVSKRDQATLDRFHKRVVQHITGVLIR